MKPKYQRLIFILICLALFIAVVALVLSALRDNMLYFYTPGDLKIASLKPGQKIRLGGLVKEGSFHRGKGLHVQFIVTDTTTDVNVVYKGILPDLFREGQGVIAEGMFIGDIFEAKKILAKHDEKYMPPEVADALKIRGVYQGS